MAYSVESTVFLSSPIGGTRGLSLSFCSKTLVSRTNLLDSDRQSPIRARPLVEDSS